MGVILDGAGDLYGEFGNDTTGDISELSPSSIGWIYTKLYEFCPGGWNCTDGITPLAPFSWDGKGNLYGTTYDGGDSDCHCGVAFQLSRNGNGTWAYHVLHRFSGHSDGCYSIGSLTADASGSLYGTAGCGPTGYGVVFKLTRTAGNHWKKTVIDDFGNGNNGFGPEATWYLIVMAISTALLAACTATECAVWSSDSVRRIRANGSTA